VLIESRNDEARLKGNFTLFRDRAEEENAGKDRVGATDLGMGGTFWNARAECLASNAAIQNLVMLNLTIQ
jgi:hypothetical protein